MATISEQAAAMKAVSPYMGTLDLEVRNKALAAIAEALVTNKNKIFEANAADIEAATKEGLEGPVIKRLRFDEAKLKDVTDGIRGLIKLEDPLFKTLLERELDEGLLLRRVTCAIGVIGVIFESRPDALVQIASLCIKSGNCAILKGGREALNTNRVLFSIIRDAACECGVPDKALLLAEARSEIAELLTCDKYVDLLIPRGSNAFVQYIMNNTKIPVMGHADGICHVYVDEDADLDMAISVVRDSKTQYVSVCNATETLLVNKKIYADFVPLLKASLDEKNVKLVGDDNIQKVIDCEAATEEDWKTEYLDYKLSIKVVDDVKEAVDHINKYGSHHTDSIVTDNAKTAEYFMQYVDSAGVYQNASTRFADGFRYGFGAEVGVSTGKLHARGPVGLEGLVTYKYKLYGSGHIVADFAEGRKTFKFNR